MESDCRIPMACFRPRALALHALSEQGSLSEAYDLVRLSWSGRFCCDRGLSDGATHLSDGVVGLGHALPQVGGLHGAAGPAGGGPALGDAVARQRRGGGQDVVHRLRRRLRSGGGGESHIAVWSTLWMDEHLIALDIKCLFYI
jgi:hypothetical protein